MKNFKIALTLGLISAVILSCARTQALCNDIKNNVLRLHIIANSDSTYDQELKLKVRDKILEVSKNSFENCTDLTEAENYVKSNLGTFKCVAEETVRENGFDYSVNVSFGESSFENRDYGDFTLPAGVYNSLKIIIGEGKGKNWWCVMFPAVCVGAAADFQDVISKDSSQFIHSADKYRVAFKSVEIYENLKKYIRL